MSKEIIAKLKQNLSRRLFLKGATLATGAVLMPLQAQAKVKKFQHGVASGDPLQTSVILWTRLALTQNKASLTWQVAKDKRFKSLVKMGEVSTTKAQDGIVKFDCRGLKAGTTYYYRFMTKEETSPVGRTKTLPVGKPNKLKLGICSCANYNAGFFTAYRGLANIDDLDAVIHLGDYIYEYGNNVYGNHALRQVKPKEELLTLEDYRARYAHYRTDADLQKVHAAHPMIAVWDDHEIANNGWKDGAQNHSSKTEGDWTARQLAARQAYFEWLPIREKSNKKIYRRFAFGDLAALIMIDTRYDARDKVYSLADFIEKDKAGKPFFNKARFDKNIFAPRRFIMSRAQSFWLKASLRWAKRNARWSLIGNQIPFQPVYFGNLKVDKNSAPEVKQLAGLLALAKKAGLKKVPLSLDEWSGFPAAQDKVVQEIKQADNPTLVLTGDTHNGWATFYGDKTGIELGTPGVSSPGTEFYFPRAQWEEVRKGFAKNNPAYIFRDVSNRGFLILEVGRNEAKASWLWTSVKARRASTRQGPSLTIPRAKISAARFKA